MSKTDSALLRRLVNGVGANIYGQLITIIIQLIGVPILLHSWGAQMYGEWIILSAFPAYLSMIDLGFSLSAANDMTARVARDDHIGALIVFQTISALVYIVILAGLLVSGLLIAFLPIGSWMHITMISVSETRWILLLLASSVLFHLADGVSHAGFRAYQEYAFHSFFFSTTLFTQQLSLWITALFGYGPVVAAGFMLVIRIVSTSALTIILFYRHRTLKPGFHYVKIQQLRNLVNPALANMAMPLAQGLNIQGLVLVIGATIGPLAVVTFSTLRTLTRFALQLVLSISHAFEPEMATAWGSDNKVMLLRLYKSSLRLSFWSALGAIISLFFLGGWIVQWWTDGTVLMNSALFNWLLLSALTSVLWYSGLNLLKAGNHHFKAAMWYVFSSLGAVILAVLILKVTGGVSKVGAALVFMDGLMIMYVFRSAATFIGVSTGKVFRSMIDYRSLVQEIVELVQYEQASIKV